MWALEVEENDWLLERLAGSLVLIVPSEKHRFSGDVIKGSDWLTSVLEGWKYQGVHIEYVNILCLGGRKIGHVSVESCRNHLALRPTVHHRPGQWFSLKMVFQWLGSSCG